MALKYVANPPNPWRSAHAEWLGEPPTATLEIYEETARSIVSENYSPDLGFRFSVNPYRGCFHACAYCYARPTHQYLDYGAGTDFERKLVVKQNAAALLEKHFRKKSWRGEALVFSGVTDCYQPLEAVYGVTRACLEVCAAFRNPVSLVTKGALVARDAELLGRLAREASAHVSVSIAFTDETAARKLEPATPLPAARFNAMRTLHEAGVPVGVALAPIIPGLNDDQVAPILEQAAACGAKQAFMTLLRLPAEVEPVFLERLEAAFEPARVRKVLNALREMREGQRNRSAFGTRMKGHGPRWLAIQRLFEITCRKLGINALEERHIGAERGIILPEQSTFRRPGETGRLF